jgi:hypothetical protein
VSNLDMMAQEAARAIATLQVSELVRISLKGPCLSKRDAEEISDRVIETGTQIIMEMFHMVGTEEIEELKAENDRLRATIDMLCDRVVEERLAAEFTPMIIPEVKI